MKILDARLLLLLLSPAPLIAATITIDGTPYDYQGNVRFEGNALVVSTTDGSHVCTPTQGSAGDDTAIVIDDYLYQMDSYTFSASLSLLDAPSVSNCRRSNGGGFSPGNHALVVNQSTFIYTNTDLQYAQSHNAVIIETVNGDAVCDGGIYVGDWDLIFQGVFE